MKILAVESSAKTASVCIAEADGRELVVQSLFTVNAGHTHSETLLPMVLACMENTKVSYDDIELFALSAGPGSFTGVRIGAATVKGIAFGRNTPCVGVSSLLTLAYNFRSLCEDEYVAAIMDARGKRYFTALFKIENGKITRLSEDEILTDEQLDERLSQLDRPVHLVGDGAKMFFDGHECTHYVLAPELLIEPNAASVAKAAYERYVSTDDKTVFTDKNLTPVYLLPSQAERERNKRLKGN